MDYKEEIKKLILKLPHKIQVEFALYCANDIKHNVRKQDLEVVNKALELTRLWVNGGDVTQAQLIQVAYSAANSANSAYSADSAAYSADKEEKYKQYYNYLKQMMEHLSKLEKIIYGLQ